MDSLNPDDGDGRAAGLAFSGPPPRALRWRAGSRDRGSLFLTMPISWRGSLAQYAGRLQRLHAAKRDVVIYDYVDEQEPILAKMAAKREAGYKALGYEVTHAGELFSRKAGISPGEKAVDLLSLRHFQLAAMPG